MHAEKDEGGRERWFGRMSSSLYYMVRIISVYQRRLAVKRIRIRVRQAIFARKPCDGRVFSFAIDGFVVTLLRGPTAADTGVEELRMHIMLLKPSSAVGPSRSGVPDGMAPMRFGGPVPRRKGQETISVVPRCAS